MIMNRYKRDLSKYKQWVETKQFPVEEFNTGLGEKFLAAKLESFMYEAADKWHKEKNEGDQFIFIDVKVTPNHDSDKRFEEARVIIYYKPKRVSIRELRERQ